jgi:cysteine desulfurase/selenocysteine lyase
MAKIEPLLSPDAFVGLEGLTHLCTGGEAPWLKVCGEVYDRFARLKSAGKEGRAEIYDCGERCREKVGALWNAPPARIGFMPSSAEGMSWLARGLDWRSGDNVVTTSLEFPSVAYAWRNLRAAGVETRLIPHHNYEVSEQELLDAVDERTRVLAVSQVSFYGGQCLDIERLADGLKKKRQSKKAQPVLLAVDATHASGVVNVPASSTDLCVSSSYKWMLATHGVAPCYLSERAEESIRETSFGWHNLDVWPTQGAERHADVDVVPMPAKLEPGNPAMVVIMMLDRALDVLLEIGIERIEAHARDLSELLTAALQKAGRVVITPNRREARSGNTVYLSEDANGEEERLAAAGVLVWGDYGRVRVSGHLYNGSDDVDRFISILTEQER